MSDTLSMPAPSGAPVPLPPPGVAAVPAPVEPVRFTVGCPICGKPPFDPRKPNGFCSRECFAIHKEAELTAKWGPIEVRRAYMEAKKAGATQQFEALVKAAHEAGVAAGDAAADPTGAFGSAAIIFPGNTPFGKWMKAKRGAEKAYPSGLRILVTYGGYSYARKSAYAYAFVKVLRDAGIKAHSSTY